MHLIEPLEARIAPAIVLLYTDVDGDAVTITISKGTQADAGLVGLTLFGPGGALGSSLFKIDLGGDPLFNDANVTVSAKPKIGMDGVLRGDGYADVGFIDADGIRLGAVTIDGDLGRLVAGTNVAGSVAVKSLSVLSLGARGTESGASVLGVATGGSIGSLKVAGSIFEAGVIASSGGSIGAVTIGGSIVAGGGSSFEAGVIKAEGDIGSVAVKGDLVGGFANITGRIEAGGKLGSVTIGGSVIGSLGNSSGQIVSGGDMGKVKIAGDLRGRAMGGNGDGAGSIVSGGKIAGVALGGALLQGNHSGGSEPGARITAAGDIGPITIAGSMIANGTGTEFGADIRSGGTITSVTVGGSIFGAQLSSGAIVADAIGSVTVRGDLRGGDGDRSGRIVAEGSIGKVAIGGSLIGGAGTTDNGAVRADDGRLGSITVGVDLRDGAEIVGARLGNVTIGGSVHVSSIIADQDIGSIAIKGSLVGIAGNLSKIFARGLAGDPVEKNLAIKSVSVGGSVENAWIFAGVLANGTAASGNAQIGAVKVDGSWIASSLLAGVNSADGVIADGDDTIIAGGTKSKIASIVIGGQVLGRVGTTETFGFAAREIGSFKVGGTAVGLTKGAANDRFNGDGTSNAKAVGPSLAPSDFFKPDAFAVHVYEV